MDTSPAGQTPAKKTHRTTIDVAAALHPHLNLRAKELGYPTLAAWTRALWTEAIREGHHPGTHPTYLAGYAAGLKEMQARVAASMKEALLVANPVSVPAGPVVRQGLPTRPPPTTPR